jgi:hypothetical protein
MMYRWRRCCDKIKTKQKKRKRKNLKKEKKLEKGKGGLLVSDVKFCYYLISFFGSQRRAFGQRWELLIFSG